MWRTQEDESATAVTSLELRSRDLVRGVVRFALRHTPRLGYYAQNWPADDSVPLTLADKVLVETALLGLVLARATATPVLSSDERQEFAQGIWSSIDAGRLTSIARRQPQMAPSLGIIVTFLRQEGIDVAAFGEAVEQAFRYGRAYATERLPYRQMETDWVAEQLSVSSAGGGEQPGYRASVLHTGLDAMYATSIDAYAFTHAVMFSSDFGARRLDHIVDLRQASEFLDAACGWQLANDNLDIVGELMMSAAYLRRRPSAHLELGGALLLSTWEELGFLPSPSMRIDELQDLPTEQRQSYSFLHVYHTNYVGALAFNAQLAGQNNPGWYPQTASTSSAAGDPAVGEPSGEPRISRLLELTRDRRTATWVAALVSKVALPNIGAVLSDMVLIEACRGYRLDIVGDELDALAAAGIADSPTAARARCFHKEHFE